MPVLPTMGVRTAFAAVDKYGFHRIMDQHVRNLSQESWPRHRRLPGEPGRDTRSRTGTCNVAAPLHLSPGVGTRWLPSTEQVQRRCRQQIAPKTGRDMLRYGGGLVTTWRRR